MLNWQVDSNPDTVKSGGKTLKIRDAYAQWLFDRGAEFRASVPLSKENPADFDFFVHSKKLTKAKRPKPIKPGQGAVSKDRFDMISLLPIAKKSVAQGALAAVSHTPADILLDPEKIVIIGIIDDGINVFNQRFRPAGRASRVDYAWAQDGVAPAQSATVPFGCELTGQHITATMDTGKDERAMLRDNGFLPAQNGVYMPSSLSHASSHGTQIADLAAGADADDIAAANTRLITVQLPAFAVMDTSGASRIGAMHHAAIYVFKRARAMSRHYLRPLPVVLNISFGLTGGPRNGQQFLERALRALAIKYQKDMRATFGDNGVPPVVRVVSAGNENILRLHAQNDGSAGLDLPVRVQPEDSTASFLEIWLPQSATSADILLTLPDGSIKTVGFSALNSAKPVDTDAHILLDDATNTTLCRVTLDAPIRRPGDCDDDLFWRVLIAIAPTAGPHLAFAQAGLWQVSVQLVNAVGNMHGWILRDQAVSGFSSAGRQAYFDDDVRANQAYVASAFDSFGDIAVDDPAARSSVIARNGAISGLATNGLLRRKNGKKKHGDGPDMDAISVGAMRWDMPHAALYSAADIVGNGQAPHVMMVAETSRMLPNIRATGLVSGTSSALNGTSAAAPIVSRIMAAHLSGLSQTDYAGFDLGGFLQSIGSAPARPIGPETASGLGIREERLRQNGVIVPLPAGLNANVQRDGLRKS